jgi:hypothetical protein
MSFFSDSTYGSIESANGVAIGNQANIVKIIRLSEQPAKYDGYVCSFQIEVQTAGVDVQFLVLRPTGSNTEYTVVHTMKYTTTALGAIAVSALAFSS